MSQYCLVNNLPNRRTFNLVCAFFRPPRGFPSSETNLIKYLRKNPHGPITCCSEKKTQFTNNLMETISRYYVRYRRPTPQTRYLLTHLCSRFFSLHNVKIKNI